MYLVTPFSPKKKMLTGQEFLQQYKEGIREFDSIQIEPETLFQGKLLHQTTTYIGINKQYDVEALADIHFHHCYLEKIIFSELDLSGTIFDDCYLGDTLFEGCNLDRTTFRDMDLAETRFSGILSADQLIFDEASNISIATFARSLPLREIFDTQFNRALVIRFRSFRPIAYHLWKVFTDCGNKNWLLSLWAGFFIMAFALAFHTYPQSFTFTADNGSFGHCLVQAIGIFVSLDYMLPLARDTFGQIVLLGEMILSYIILGLLASFFATTFPRRREM